MSTMSASAARTPASPRALPAGPSVANVTIHPLKVAVQYRYWLITAAILGVVVGIASHILFSRISPQFRATTTYLTLPPMADPSKPEAAFTDREEFERFAATQARILNSERLLLSVVNGDPQLLQTKWSQSYLRNGKLDPGEATEALRDIVRGRVVTGTSLIEMVVTTSVPEDAKVIAEAVHRAYFKELAAGGQNKSQEQREPLNNQLNQTLAEIRRIDTQISQRQAERGITGEAGWDAVVMQIQSLNPQLIEVTQRLERARTRMATLEGQLKPGQAIVFTDEQREETEKDPNISSLKSRLSQIRAEMDAKGQAGIGPEHKEYYSLRTLAEQTEAQLNAEREKTLRKLFDSEFDRTRQARDAAESEYKVLTTKLAELIRKREEITRAQSEIELLKADREKLNDQAAQRRSAIADLDLVVGVDKLDRMGRVRRIDAPRTPDRMAFPRLEIMIPLGVILVLALTVGVIVVREVVDQRVKGPADIGLVRGVRLVGIVPNADEDPTRPASVETAFRDSPTGAVSEGFRQARAQIVKRMQQSGHKSLLVIAGAPESGATSTVANVAMGLAASEMRVLVIDGNFRRPGLHRVFKLAEGPGLGDVLMHKATLETAVQQTSFPNLSLLAAGSGPSRAVPERLATETMSKIIKDATAKYDMVIIDSAPAIIAGEGLALANRCDAAVMVVRAYSEKRGLIARLRDQLADARADFLGVVVNGVRGSSGGYLRKNIKASADYQSGAAA